MAGKFACIRCYDKKTYTGHGYQQRDCELCAKKDTAVTIDKIDRRSASYKSAIADIMKATNCTKFDAIRQFDEAY